MAAASAEEVPAGVEVEEDHEDDDEEEDDDGAQHDLAAHGVGSRGGGGFVGSAAHRILVVGVHEFEDGVK
ncbi:hypothetical protein Bca4012_084847 [Brassica carinata]